MTTSFKPIRTLSVAEFKEEFGYTSLDLYRSKDDTAYYLAANGQPHNGAVCFLSTKAQENPRSLTQPVISEIQATDEKTGKPIMNKSVYVMHNQGKEAVMSF